MLELEEAREQILAALPALTQEIIAVGEADGRVLAEPVRADIDLPGFDNSAMDGYAVRAADVAAATVAAPVRSHLAGKVAAGEHFSGELAPGNCIRIFTGSPLPRGADAVVMQEDTRSDPNASSAVRIFAPVAAGENVRRRGEDIRVGQIVLNASERLGPGQLSLLAAVGVREVRVGRAPVVGLLATGSELINPGAEPGLPPPGHIYESNGAGLAALARRASCRTRIYPAVPDELQATRQALEGALSSCDVLVTTGGVSVGEMDFVKQAFSDIGGELQFWKVAVKPGRPFAFGRWRDRFLFGLPGNPVSAIITFLLLVRPALLRWQGALEISLPAHPGTLAEPLSNAGGRRHFMRVRANADGSVHSAGTQASHVLGSLAAANGLVDVPPETTWPAGKIVTVYQWQ